MTDFDFDVAFTKLEDKNVLARGEFAEQGVVTIMTAPSSSIDGVDGPVLIAGADPLHVNVVYSDEFIERLVPDGLSEKEIAESMRAIAKVIANGMHIGREFVRSTSAGFNQPESDSL
jgi:phage terminase large subunit-like protein